MGCSCHCASLTCDWSKPSRASVRRRGGRTQPQEESGQPRIEQVDKHHRHDCNGCQLPDAHVPGVVLTAAACRPRGMLRADVLPGAVFAPGIFAPLAPQLGAALLARFLHRVVIARNIVELVRVFLERCKAQHKQSVWESKIRISESKSKLACILPSESILGASQRYEKSSAETNRRFDYAVTEYFSAPDTEIK